MPDSATALKQFEQVVEQEGIGAGLDRLVQQLRSEQSFFELFEALKMQVRHRLSLPIVHDDSSDDLDDGLRQQLEEGLLEACQEVGISLLESGKVREGWAYLRPVGNHTEAAKSLRTIEPNDENIDELVEVSLHEGVDVARGYELVLSHYGTCNAITSLESIYQRLPIADRRSATALLVRHVHQELLSSVTSDISRREGKPPADSSLENLVENRPELFGEHSYHLDTTHLASTVRLSRVLDDAETLRLAVDLTEYGHRLSEPFQYAGEEPFVDLYPSHAIYLRALLRENVDEAIQYFRERAQELDPDQHGTQAIETLIELLDRLGYHDRAISALLGFAAGESESASQIFPLLLGLSEKAGTFTELIEYCRGHEDLLGFATGVLCQHGSDARRDS